MFLLSPSCVLELGISPVVQWLRILHAMQGTQVQSLVGKQIPPATEQLNPRAATHGALELQ